MKIIGVTGKSGSGKTTFASLLSKKLNCKYVDIDKIGHESILQTDIAQMLCEKFGKEILNEQGKIERKQLGNIVFAQKQKMQELTDLTWGYMQKTIDKILSQEKTIILDWILLPNSKYWKMCNPKILVTAKEEVRKAKVIERDNISEEYFTKRDSASIDYSKFKFDYIIENDYKIQTINKMIEKDMR